MNGNFKKLGLFGALASAAFLATSAASASSYSLTAGGVSYGPNQGLTTSVVGATVVDFNSSLLNPAGYTGGAVKIGSSSGNWASPPNDTSNFYTVGPGAGQSTPGTVLLTSLSKYFGYFGGSPDTYNAVELWRDGTKLQVYSGTDLANAAKVNPNGNQTTGAYWNIWALDASSYFNKVLFISSSNAFETDNHAFLATPLPAAIWLFGSALLGFISLSNRRRV
jgi:hypothetical protein